LTFAEILALINVKPDEKDQGGAGGGIPPGQAKKTDEEILEEVENELPSLEVVEELAREVFLRLLPGGIDLSGDPTFNDRQKIDKIRRHALQIASAWVWSFPEVNQARERVKSQKFRIKKFKED
jgi:hypothetical protein